METKIFLRKRMLAILAFILVSSQLDDSIQSVGHGRSVTNTLEAVHSIDANDIQRVTTVSYEIFGEKNKIERISFKF